MKTTVRNLKENDGVGRRKMNGVDGYDKEKRAELYEDENAYDVEKPWDWRTRIAMASLCILWVGTLEQMSFYEEKHATSIDRMCRITNTSVLHRRLSHVHFKGHWRQGHHAKFLDSREQHSCSCSDCPVLWLSY